MVGGNRDWGNDLSALEEAGDESARYAGYSVKKPCSGKLLLHGKLGGTTGALYLSSLRGREIFLYQIKIKGAYNYVKHQLHQAKPGNYQAGRN